MVTEYKPDWLFVYTGRLSEDNDIQMADRLTQDIGCQTVFAGPYSSIFPKKLLKKSKNVKFLITGEFEQPAKEIVEGRKPSEILNLIYKEDNEIIQNEERPYLNTYIINFFKNIFMSIYN